MALSDEEKKWPWKQNPVKPFEGIQCNMCAPHVYSNVFTDIPGFIIHVRATHPHPDHLTDEQLYEWYRWANALIASRNRHPSTVNEYTQAIGTAKWASYVCYLCVGAPLWSDRKEYLAHLHDKHLDEITSSTIEVARDE